MIDRIATVAFSAGNAAADTAVDLSTARAAYRAALMQRASAAQWSAKAGAPVAKVVKRTVFAAHPATAPAAEFASVAGTPAVRLRSAAAEPVFEDRYREKSR